MRVVCVLTALAALALGSVAAAEPPVLVAAHVELQTNQAPMAPLGNLLTMYTAKELQAGVYVGAEYCIACHGQQYAGWRDTKHSQALRKPMAEYSLMPGKGVVADYDGNGVDDFMQGLDFNQISSAFDAYKPNAPVLGYTEGQYWIRIGELTNPVVITQGGTGEWKQRYLVRVPVTDTPDGLSVENYVSPVQFNESTHRYVTYDPGDWYDSSNQPKFGTGTTAAQLAAGNGRTYSKKCIGCHTTGIRELGQTASGEWYYRGFVAVLFDPSDPTYPDYDHDGNADLVNISCEACHGPGSAHILGGGNPALIANPGDMDTEQANQICEQCHVRVKSVPGAKHDWPYNDETHTAWTPLSGEDLSDYYTDAAGTWPDGIHSKQHHQQYRDFYQSSKPTFPFHPMKCVECHDPHMQTGNLYQVVSSIEDGGLVIPTADENDTLCLACHATHGAFEEITKEQVAEFAANRDHIRNVVEAHTYHPFAPERSMGLSRCSACHMPKTAKTAENHDIASHTFEPIAPEKTLAYQAQGGMPNACAVACHSTKVNSFGLGLDPAYGTWNEGFDVTLAEILQMVYGPGGAWWDTSDPKSMTYRAMQKAAAPGEIPYLPEEAMGD